MSAFKSKPTPPSQRSVSITSNAGPITKVCNTLFCIDLSKFAYHIIIDILVPYEHGKFCLIINKIQIKLEVSIYSDMKVLIAFHIFYSHFQLLFFTCSCESYKNLII